jgi:hypothetical protein
MEIVESCFAFYFDGIRKLLVKWAVSPDLILITSKGFKIAPATIHDAPPIAALSIFFELVECRSAREISERSAREISERSARENSERSAREISERSGREISRGGGDQGGLRVE